MNPIQAQIRVNNILIPILYFCYTPLSCYLKYYIFVLKHTYQMLNIHLKCLII